MTMVDIKDLLLANNDVTALVADRVYAGRTTPPRTWRPHLGPCVVFGSRGGTMDYASVLLQMSIQVQCYASSELATIQLADAVVNALQDTKYRSIRHAEVEVLPQPLEELNAPAQFFALIFFDVIAERILWQILN